MSYYTQFPRRYDELAICLDSYKESGIAGRAYFGSRQEPTLFRDIGALLIQFDGFLDTLGKPQASTALRRFSQKRQKNKGTKGIFTKEEVISLKQRTDIHPKGESATFVVQVEFRQNSTWQGNVTWVEAGEKQNFRSALELLMLMESAMTKDEAPENISLAEEA